MKYILLLTLAVNLSGCVKITDVEEGKPVAVQSPEVEFVAGSEPNDYQVILRMPEGTQSIIRRDVNAIDGNEIAVPILTVQGKLADQRPIAGTLYEYEFGALSGGNFSSLKRIRVQVPKDLVVEGVVELDSIKAADIKNFRRLFMKPQSTLRTNGHSIEFVIEEFVSDDGVIETFAVNTKAPDDKIGRSGGVIKITSKIMRGKLKVFLRGEEGGNGLDGAPYSEIAAQGRMAQGRELAPGARCYGQGFPGADGQAGRNGGAGKMGGDSGRLILLSENQSELILDIIKEPGVGGIGGKGAPGQLGGKGGPSIAGGPKCPRFGDPGKPGKHGEDGVPGIPGQKLD